MLFMCASVCDSGLAELTESSVPTLKVYLQPALEQLTEREKMTEQERSEQDEDELYKNDRLFVW
jgi:hypothetical protein